MFYTYVLRSQKDQTRYIGNTENIDIRLIEHNNGRVRYTKGKRPWKIIHTEEFNTRTEARIRELFLKSGQGRKYLEKVCA